MHMHLNLKHAHIVKISRRFCSVLIEKTNKFHYLYLNIKNPNYRFFEKNILQEQFFLSLEELCRIENQFKKKIFFFRFHSIKLFE